MKNVIYFLFICLFFACKPNGSETKTATTNNSNKYPQYVTMMQTHDQTMKSMARLAELQKAVKEKLHAYEAANDFGPLSKEVRSVLSELNKGENAIATWKDTYGRQLPDTMKDESRNNYFIVAGGEVEQARDIVLYSIQQAERMLQKLEGTAK